MKWGVDKGGAMEELVEMAESGPLLQLRDNMEFVEKRDANFFTRVKNRELAFLSSDAEVRYLITEDFLKDGSCEMMIAKEPVFTSSVSFVVNKNEPKGFKDRLDFEWVFLISHI